MQGAWGQVCDVVTFTIYLTFVFVGLNQCWTYIQKIQTSRLVLALIGSNITNCEIFEVVS
jgi:hypothetical protein